MEQLDAPKFTANGTAISAEFRGTRDKEGNPYWIAGPPSLYDFRCLRTPDFNWNTDAHEIFFLALNGHSQERRIKDDNKGLFEEAARTLIRRVSQLYSDELNTARVFTPSYIENIDKAVNDIITEMTDNYDLKMTCNEYTKLMLAISLSNSELTNGNPLLSVSDRNPFRIGPEEGAVLLQELRQNKLSIVRRINNALDVIAVYTSVDERIAYVELEIILTSMRRVVYAVHNRAY